MCFVWSFFLCWYSIIEQCISVKHNLFRFLSKVDSKLDLYEVFCSIDISTKIGLWRYCRNTRISNTLATQCFSIRAPTIFFFTVFVVVVFLDVSHDWFFVRSLFEPLISLYCACVQWMKIRSLLFMLYEKQKGFEMGKTPSISVFRSNSVVIDYIGGERGLDNR